MGNAKQPNFRMRQLARTLRALREEVGYTQEESAGKLRFSDSKICRIEQGQLPGYHEFLAMLDIYGIVVNDYGEYIRMYERAEEKGWWHAYGLNDRGFVSAEAEASTVRTFQLAHIPGLLQTEAYMRELFTATYLPRQQHELENQVAVRLRRQRRLTDEPLLHLHAVIDESALHRPIGTRDQHHAQLRQVVDRARLANVTIQVIPTELGAHSGQQGSFTVLSFPDPAEAALVYVEQPFTSFCVEKEPEVSAARMVFDHLADLALDEDDSQALVERAATGR
ncbi:helix-turn-helix transcriptional regulator [Haloechinothrix aidingensis]